MKNRKYDMEKKIVKIKKNVFLYINFRVLFLSLAVAAVYLWSTPSSFFIAHSEEIEKNDIKRYSNDGLNPDVETDYRLKTNFRYCEEDKKNKRDSIPCGQSIKLDRQEELVLEKQARPAEEPPEIQPEIQKSAVAAKSKIIIRKPPVQKISCREKNDHPGKSDIKGRHQDEDCCPDPDEWPMPGCVYSLSGRALMLKKPK
jgi:hypothetical protein